MAAYDTGTYEFSADAGVDSTGALKALVASSGIGFTVTSAFRNEANSWHSQYNAIDVASTQADMTTIANYLLQYHEYLLELIHTNSDGSGAYVKNGKVVGADFYGAVTVSEHRDHVHVAGTYSAMLAAAKATAQFQAQQSTTTGLGCSKNASVFLLMLMASIFQGDQWLTVVHHLLYR